MEVLLVQPPSEGDASGEASGVKEHLRESRHSGDVRRVRDLEAARSEIEEQPPDVVVLDGAGLDPSSPKATREIAQAFPSLPIVVLTGPDGDGTERQQVLEAGATECLRRDECTPAFLRRALHWAHRQKSTERALEKRERELRSITENVTQGIYRSVPEEGLVYVNQAFADIFGYESPEAIKAVDPVELYVRPERRAELRDRLRREGQIENEEVLCRRKDGSTFTALQSGMTVRDESDEIISYDGTVTDISDRKEAQRRLEESQKRTQSVLNGIAANIAVLGPEGTIVDVNEQWRRFARENGGDLEELGVGANYLAACRQGDDSPIPAVREHLKSVLQGEEDIFEQEYPCHSPEERRWFLLRATPLDREGGGAVVAHINVTKRVEAAREQRVLSEAVQQAKESVLITEAEPLDPPGPKIVYVNSATQEMTGYAEKELLGQTPRVLQGPNTERDVLDSLREALEAGEEWEGETVNYRKDGEAYRVQWNVSPVRSEDGEIEHWVSVQRDVTEERKREETLRRQKNLLEQTQRLAGAWEVDLRSGDISWSDKVYEIHELTPGVELQRGGGFEFYPPGAQPTIREAFDRCVEEGEAYDLELPLDTAEGDRRWVRTVGAPAETKDGEVVKVAGAFQDITDRKEAEEALQQREAQLRGLTNSIPGVVFQAYARPGREYGFYFVSDRAEDVMGISADPEDFFKRCMDRVPESERKRIMGVIEEAAETQGHLEFEAPFVKPSGETIWLLGTAAPKPREEEVVYNGVILDISQRRRQKKRLATIVDRVTDAIVEVDSEWCFTLVNEQAETLYDMAEENLLGEHFWDVFEGALGTRFEEEYRKVMQTREPTRFEAYYPGLEGWFDIQVYPNEDGGIAFYFEEVTEQRRQQKELERQNDLFSKAQSLAQVGAWEYDVGTETSIWTDELYRICGLSPGTEPSLEQGFALYREEDRKTVKEAFRRAIEEGEPYDLEARLTQPDGEERWIRTKAEPQTDREGRTVRVRGAIRDITDRKRHEQRLQRTTSLLQLTEELTDVGGWTVDTTGGRPYRAEWTENLYEIFGLSPEKEPPTAEVFEYYHSDDRDRHKEAVLRAEQDWEGWDQELRLIREDGETRWVHNVGRPVVEEGEVVQIQGAIQDITARKEREEELQETKHLLEKTLESLSKAVVVVDPADREVITCNSAVTEIFGYDPEELLGRSTEILHLSQDAYERFGNLGEPQLEDKGQFSTEYQMRRKDGTIIDTKNVVTPLKGDDWPGGVVSVIRDITGRKNRERELREAKEEAERMNRLKSAFLANMSHEIRTPLTSILGFAEIIGDEVETLTDCNQHLELSTLRRYSGLIQKSGHRLMNMLEDTLNLSKLEAGEMDLSAETIDLAGAVTEVAEEFEVRAEQAGIDLKVEIVGDEVEACADPEGVQIALRNLVSNALKYTESGGEVYVRAHRSGEAPVIEVEDTGIGMDPERVPELFEAFAQESQGMSREYEGSGLGLTVTKRVVRQMGGDIEVESEKGKGSCFTVRLPVAEDAAKA
ncbi:PAS domain S-box protein [Salinibacter ruber]|uniref:PAS domain S-box protein n=1 Tax=Salinibacter ruber TaxID=146919 RepID=UPI0020738850|nr:PAS domain S-box protein [Salinibacter ruber]